MPQKCFEEKCVDLLLIAEEDKTHYVLIKHLSTNMYGHSLLCGRKIFVVIVYKVLAQKCIKMSW